MSNNENQYQSNELNKQVNFHKNTKSQNTPYKSGDIYNLKNQIRLTNVEAEAHLNRDAVYKRKPRFEKKKDHNCHDIYDDQGRKMGHQHLGETNMKVL